METDQMAASVSELQAVVKNIDRDISRLQTLIEAEDDKMLRYKVHLLYLRCSHKMSFFFVMSVALLLLEASYLISLLQLFLPFLRNFIFVNKGLEIAF